MLVFEWSCGARLFDPVALPAFEARSNGPIPESDEEKNDGAACSARFRGRNGLRPVPCGNRHAKANADGTCGVIALVGAAAVAEAVNRGPSLHHALRHVGLAACICLIPVRDTRRRRRNLLDFRPSVRSATPMIAEVRRDRRYLRGSEAACMKELR